MRAFDPITFKENKPQKVKENRKNGSLYHVKYFRPAVTYSTLALAYHSKHYTGPLVHLKGPEYGCSLLPLMP